MVNTKWFSLNFSLNWQLFWIVLYNLNQSNLFSWFGFLNLCKILILLSFLGGCNLAQISFRQALYTSFVLSNRSLKALWWIVHPATYWSPVSNRRMWTVITFISSCHGSFALGEQNGTWQQHKPCWSTLLFICFLLENAHRMFLQYIRKTHLIFNHLK